MHPHPAAKLLAPYLAVAVFWCGFSNGWLALLAYHAQILYWARKPSRKLHRPKSAGLLLMALPAALAGPLVYLLLPVMTRTGLAAWMTEHHVSGWSLLLMVPYFGLVHPFLEQLHWAPLRERTRLAHPLFAGYHLLVLYSLLSLPWLLVCFGLLTAASYLWTLLTRRSDSLWPAVLSHVLADLGIVLAAGWMSV